MQRLGGLLTVLLGGVLIFFGLSGPSVNGVVSLPTCGLQAQLGSVTPTTCAMGTITITKTVVGGQAPLGNWNVTLASTNCILPIGAQTAYAIPAAGGSVVTSQLYRYAGVPTDTSTPCMYTLTETAVTNYAPSFAPAGPYVLPSASTGVVSNLDVALTNTYTGPTTTPTPTPTTSAVPAPSTTSGSDILAATGPDHTNLQVILGAALVLLGVVLTVAPRRGSHQR